MAEKPKVDRTRAYIRRDNNSVSILVPVGDVYSRDFHGELNEEFLEKVGSMMYGISYMHGMAFAESGFSPFSTIDIENYQVSDIPKEDIERIRELVGKVRANRGKSTFQKYDEELSTFSLELAKRYIEAK